MTEPTSPSTTTRRMVLRTGAAGAAAAFLAACTDARKESGPKSGQSGAPVTTTSEAPTVPTTEPGAEDVEYDTTLARTATSLELVVAGAYATYGPALSDTTWKEDAARFQADHEANATAFQDDTKPASKAVTKPNAFVQENVIDPLAATLPTAGDVRILDFFRGLESMLVATYVAAAGGFSDTAWRSKIMHAASASASRVGVLSNGGEGGLSGGALYPLTDLIANDAYVPVKAAKAGA